MAHLLGQLGLPANPSAGVPLLHRSAMLTSLMCPQPAYVYALLLLGEFSQLPQQLPHTAFLPFLPPPTSDSAQVPGGEFFVDAVKQRRLILFSQGRRRSWSTGVSRMRRRCWSGARMCTSRLRSTSSGTATNSPTRQSMYCLVCFLQSRD